MINPKTNRFYWLMIQQDLFGTWCLCKVYGGLNNNHRRELWIPCNNELQANQLMTELEYRRRQRGYIYADISVASHFALRPQTFDEVLEGL
jgi:predicted DNA-binding WGR domain protein